MSLIAQIKDKQRERKTVLEQAGAILTKAHKNKRSLTAEENTEFEARHTDGDRLLKEIEQVQKQLDAEQSLGQVAEDTRSGGREDVRGGVTANQTQDPEKRAKEEKAVFRKWMAGGVGELTAEERSILNGNRATLRPEDMPAEARALSASTGSAGAYTIPQNFMYTLDQALKYYGGIIDAADEVPTDNGAVLPYPSVNDTAQSGEQIAENTTAASTGGDPSYGVVNLSAYMFDSKIVLVPVQLLQDSAFDVESFFAEALKTRLGRQLNAKCTTGTGSSQPNGVVTASTLGVSAAGATAITYNEVLALLHSVDPAYRQSPKCGFMFNDSTLLLLRKLVDGNSRPLFIAGGVAEGIQNSNPDTISGKKFWINQDMASATTGQKSMLFGDFSKYKIRKVRQVQMVRFSERFMDALQVGFIAFQRFDGNLVDAGTHPIKYLLQA